MRLHELKNVKFRETINKQNIDLTIDDFGMELNTPYLVGVLHNGAVHVFPGEFYIKRVDESRYGGTISGVNGEGFLEQTEFEFIVELIHAVGESGGKQFICFNEEKGEYALIEAKAFDTRVYLILALE